MNGVVSALTTLHGWKPPVTAPDAPGASTSSVTQDTPDQPVVCPSPVAQEEVVQPSESSGTTAPSANTTMKAAGNGGAFTGFARLANVVDIATDIGWVQPPPPEPKKGGCTVQ